MDQVDKTGRGLVGRIIGTVITFTAFLVGTLIYVGFYTSGYSLFQKIVVFLVGFILAVAVIAIMWIAWAGRRGWIHGRWGP
jgi:hypothetical protein